MFMSRFFINTCRSHRSRGHRLLKPFGFVSPAASGFEPRIITVDLPAVALCASSFEEIAYHG